jgi:hypothetical protein
MDKQIARLGHRQVRALAVEDGLQVGFEAFRRSISIAQHDDDGVLVGKAADGGKEIARHISAHFSQHRTCAGLARGNRCDEPAIAPIAQAGAKHLIANLLRK